MRSATEEAAWPVGEAPVNLSEQVYEAIKRELIELRLLPGDHFTESGLVARLGVSRTPVRQALYRLEHDGYVLVHQRSGWQVRPFDFKRFEALYDVRLVLELAAVETLCEAQHIDVDRALDVAKQDWLVPPDRRLRAWRDIAGRDEAFHCMLVAAAGNAEMTQIHREVIAKIAVIRRVGFTVDTRVNDIYTEHAAILRAVLARKPAVAQHMLRSHIEASKAEIRKITMHRLQAARV
jgi:DNA-binding GntR family transcriptional regulator